MLVEVIVFVCIILHVKSLIRTIAYKIAYKDKAIVLYFPFLGYVAYQLYSFMRYGDIFHYQKLLVKKNPNAKIIIGNFLLDFTIFFIDPGCIKEVSQKINEIHKNILIPDFVGFNHGLLLQEGSIWKLQRQILSKSFSFDELKSKIPMIIDISEKKLKNTNLEHEQVHLLHFFIQITSEVIFQTFFGSEPILNEKIDGKSFGELQIFLLGEFSAMNRSLFYHYKIKFFPQTSFYLLPTQREKIFTTKMEILNQIIEKIVLKRIQAHQQRKFQTLEHNNFLDVYIDYYIKNNISIDKDIITQILNQFSTLFFAGSDTTAHLLAFMSYQLAIQPELQEIVRKEFNSLDLEKIELKDIQNLKIFQNLINETLRMFPPAPFLVMRKTVQNTKIQEFDVPAGTQINTLCILVMNNEKYFSNPDQFNIKRWENEIKDPYHFIPFSAGPRHCIGQHLAVLEAKIIIGISLMYYNFEKIEGKQVKLLERSLYEFDDNNLVKFKRRQVEKLK